MANRHNRTLKFFKWFGGVVLFLVLLTGSASWYISAKYKPRLTRELKAFVLASTDSLYRIDFSRIRTNLLTGTASVSDVIIVADTIVYNNLVKAGKAPDNIYDLRLKKLSVNDFHPWLIFHNKELNIGRLLFERPEIIMINKHYDFNENLPPRPRRSPYQYISKFLKLLHIDEIDFTNASFKYINNNGPVPETDSVQNLNIFCKDYLIDQNSAMDDKRMYLFKEMNISLNNYQYETPDKFYKISLEQLNFTASTGKLNISRFAFTPLYDEMKFGKAAGYARDRFDIKMNNISLDGIKLPLYVKKQELFATGMSVENGSVAVFSDNSQPKRISSKIGKFPHQLLQQLKARLTIKKIDLKDIDISYSEFDSESRQRGKISFERTSGQAFNVTNAPLEIRKDPLMKLNLTTWLMGKGKLDVGFNFDLSASNGAFSYNGKLHEMDGKVMNRITKPLGMVQINRAKVKDMAFSIKADSYRSAGTMAFRFNDLSVAMLKKDTEKNKLVRQGLISFLANNLIIYSDNPSADKKFTRAVINYTRPETASFFSFIWRSLFTGIKYSVGVTPAKESAIRSKIAQFEQMKVDRTQRRETREMRKRMRNR